METLPSLYAANVPQNTNGTSSSATKLFPLTYAGMRQIASGAVRRLRLPARPPARPPAAGRRSFAYSSTPSAFASLLTSSRSASSAPLARMGVPIQRGAIVTAYGTASYDRREGM